MKMVITNEVYNAESASKSVSIQLITSSQVKTSELEWFLEFYLYIRKYSSQALILKTGLFFLVLNSDTNWESKSLIALN